MVAPGASRTIENHTERSNGYGAGNGGTDRKPVLVIVGPTAVGKSKVAVELALRLGGEIISADSMQVYRLMDIGTAKLTESQRRGVPHHLIDVVWPDEQYSVARYQKEGRSIIKECHQRGSLPIVVGGTGLYVDALVQGYCFADLKTDWKFRRELETEARDRGVETLYNRLTMVDPEAASKIHPNDLRRIVRALEIFLRTGRPRSYYDRLKGVTDFDAAWFGLTRPRQDLYRRIDERVDRMIESGFIDEVKGLLEKGYHRDLFSMKSLGYREITDYLYGLSTRAEAIRLAKRNTRRYAKRQFTWFKRKKGITWINLGDLTVDEAITQVLCSLEGKRKSL